MNELSTGTNGVLVTFVSLKWRKLFYYNETYRKKTFRAQILRDFDDYDVVDRRRFFATYFAY